MFMPSHTVESGEPEWRAIRPDGQTHRVMMTSPVSVAYRFHSKENVSNEAQFPSLHVESMAHHDLRP